jgi:hypothetical protein
MTELTERYLAAALRGIPERQRADVERELRSSIADAVEDRASSGQERGTAEREVLNGLGDPTRLAAGIAGRPLHLIGPDLFVEYRQLLVMLLSIVMPIVGIVQLGVAIASGETFIGALLAGAAGAWTVGVHLFFWITIVFAAMERFDAMRDAREGIAAASGTWNVDRLPALPKDRVTASETVGEVLTTILTIGGILFLNSVAWFSDEAGEIITLFNPDLWSLWMPLFIVVFAGLAVVQVLAFLVGRWTIPLAVGYTVLDLAFAVPVIVLALSGSLINPAFAEALGWPPLAEGDGPVMIAVAVVTALVTGWEIIDAFRRARRADTRAASMAHGEAAR